MSSFVKIEKPLLTVMIKQTQNPDNIIAEIGRALNSDAEAFGIQTEGLPRKYHTEENIKSIFAAANGKPIYVTNYKLSQNENMTYDEIADELLLYADYGATLCDVMGDMYCKHDEEITDNPEAINKQIELINKLHLHGAEVLMSSHVNKFTPAERVLEIALEHKKRGADISKIVTHADSMEQQIENLRITNLLKEKADIPFLFLSGGECLIHRRLGIVLGCCMSLCVCELAEGSTNPQPLIVEQREIRDKIHLL